jgi:nucleotidyltransferase/DNA polymerase involved in DNA repair
MKQSLVRAVTSRVEQGEGPPVNDAAAHAPGAEPMAHAHGGGRRVMAVVLPDLLVELALQRISMPCVSSAVIEPAVTVPRAPSPVGPARPAGVRGSGPPANSVPRAVVLVEFEGQVLEPNARLDAVNGAARRRGVHPRRTIAQATAMVENLAVFALPLACVNQSLKQVAEAALSFGSPVAFEAPDTVWVDVTGTRHLFGSEQDLALALVSHVRALGHTVRVAGAPGPWLAQAFARHSDFDETGVFLVSAENAAAQTASLPIAALPISSEAVTWFSRLGLLSLEDLRKLPPAALAARLESPGAERTLDLIQGRDDGVLAAHLPEDLPLEEQSWDCPLENVEPLLFVLKGLAARLASRLEGRGQAARELLLTIQYDRAIIALRSRERALSEPQAASKGGQEEKGDAFSKELPFRLATPLSHADELERVVRSRLQREKLVAPARGLRLRVTGITEAQHRQLGLDADTGLDGSLSADPRIMAVLVAELSADIGGGAVGLLEARDSHLPEKSSCFIPMEHVSNRGAGSHGAGSRVAGSHVSSSGPHAKSSVRSRPVLELPTRLITPIEIEAPLREKELVVLGQSAYIIESIVFEQRLEAIEWWAAAPVSRDYFRLWLTSLAPAGFSSPGYSSSPANTSSARPGASELRTRRDGLMVLAFLNRENGKKYVQAVYD